MSRRTRILASKWRLSCPSIARNSASVKAPKFVGGLGGGTAILNKLNEIIVLTSYHQNSKSNNNNKRTKWHERWKRKRRWHHRTLSSSFGIVLAIIALLSLSHIGERERKCKRRWHKGWGNWLSLCLRHVDLNLQY